MASNGDYQDLGSQQRSGPRKGAGVAVGFWFQADEGQSGIRTDAALAIVFYNLRGCLIQKLCNAEQIRRVEQNVFSFTAIAATAITGKSEGRNRAF